MKKFGIRTDGVELELEQIIRDVVRSNDSPFFLEVGAAGCQTLKSINEIIRETDSNKPYFLVSLDLPQGYAAEYKEIIKNFPSGLFISDATGLENEEEISLTFNVPHLILVPDGAKFIKENLGDCKIDFIFIDANHNKESVIKDFLAVEKKIAMGGLVLFHDFGRPEAGTDPQPGGGFIEVREACKELGLIDNIRPNWKFIKEIKGTRYEGGEGNSIGVFERI